jgi:hypothetical protein
MPWQTARPGLRATSPHRHAGVWRTLRVTGPILRGTGADEDGSLRGTLSKPFSLLPSPRCIAGPGAPAEQQSGPAEARWGCGFAPRLFGLDGDLSIGRSMRFPFCWQWLWRHGCVPESLAQVCREQVYDQDDPGGYQDGDPDLGHSSFPFSVTTMPGNRVMAVPVGSSVRSAMEAGRFQSPMRAEASASEQRKITSPSSPSS